MLGCVAVSIAFGDAGAPTDSSIASIPAGLFSHFSYTTHDKMAALPNSLLAITLASNFGTFILYGLSCILCMVAYHKHPNFSFVRHLLVPVLGILANLGCMAAYLIFPFQGIGTKKEPLIALGIAAVWGAVWRVLFPQDGEGRGADSVDADQDAGRVAFRGREVQLVVVDPGASRFFDDVPGRREELRSG